MWIKKDIEIFQFQIRVELTDRRINIGKLYLAGGLSILNVYKVNLKLDPYVEICKFRK